MAIFKPINQCIMCGEFNAIHCKTCKGCKCRKYLKPCYDPKWENKLNTRSWWFNSGFPKDQASYTWQAKWELSLSLNGWIIFKNEEYTGYFNPLIPKGSVDEAKRWAMYQVLREEGRL